MDTPLDKGQHKEVGLAAAHSKNASREDFVLDKTIFSNVFEKDIQKVFIYKKAERLAKAIHLITPAFAESPSLKNRIDAVAVSLIDAAILGSPSARSSLARELLALSSILSLAQSGGLLSPMNAELISREAQLFLHEVAAYKEPRVLLEDAPTLAQMMQSLGATETSRQHHSAHVSLPASRPIYKGHIKDNGKPNGRKESILSIIKDKGQASIKDISLRIQGVSEKTIQRELQALVAQGLVLKRGNRRWSSYSLA